MGRFGRRAFVLGAVAAGLAACSDAGPTTTSPGPSVPTSPPPSSPPIPSSPAPGPTPTAPTTTAPPVDPRPRWPLTGELLEHEGDARHAAVAVKVPDNRQEHPQRGIDSADIVFVELEGYRDASGHSATRLVPVFHSRMPDVVEPVRSIRPVDVALLSPMDAIIGNTGAAPWVLDYVRHHRAHLEGMLSYQATKGTGAYGTDQSRVYTLGGQAYFDRATTCHPKVLARQTTRFRTGPPRLYLPIASSRDEVSTAHRGKPGRTLQVPYQGDGYLMGYTYDTRSGRYLRSMPWGPHVLADGTRVSTDNVLVVHAHQHYGKIFPGAGRDEPLHDVTDASGRFLYFHGGRHVTGTWRKGALAEPFGFTLADGSPLRMAPGQTFVELPDTRARLRIRG